jgi:hypothetical protein
MNKLFSVVKLIVRRFFYLLVPVLLIWVVASNWSFLFKKRIVGELIAVERVMAPVAILNNSNDPINKENFSFSIAIKDLQTTEIHMASSEDRKWAAVQKGNCVVAAFFPYPPWNISRGTTDHNARLLRNFDRCDQTVQEESLWDQIRFFFLWM